MGEKKQMGFQIDSDVISEFEETLNEFKEVTGIKPVRQEAVEVAMKEYAVRLKKKIEALKSI